MHRDISTVPPADRHLHGRATDLAQLATFVAEHPLVTVTGPGGVGKSSLAEAVARSQRDSFPDGIVVVRLAEVRSGGVLDVVSSVVELPRTGGGDRQQALARWLRPRRALVVVDNCEHVIDEVVEVLAPLLDRSSPVDDTFVHVLATSRRPLGVPRELVVPLGPLPLPASDDRSAVAASPSVSLFVDRARGRDHTFVVPDAHWAAVAEVCRRLDGLPLALELAAGRVGSLGVPRLLSRLRHDLTVVDRPDADTSGRLRTMEAVYDWSELLLTERERTLLRGLSVFVGSFTIDAVDAVLGGTEVGEWDEALTTLVESSLVVRDHVNDRYRLLETVRQCAGTRWDDEQHRAATVRRHAEHYLAAATRAGVGFTSGPERQWLEALTRDEPNVRAALRHALAAGDGTRDADLATAALAATAGLPLYWWTRGQHREGFDWIGAALDAVGTAADPELRAAGLFGQAFLWAHDGDDWPAAATYLRAGIDLLGGPDAEPGSTPILGYLLCLLGEAHAFVDEHDQALALTRRGRDVIARFDDPWGLAFAEWNVGFAHQRAGDDDAATVHYDEMIRIQTAHGSRLELMIGHNSLGEVAERRGDVERARKHYAQALELRLDLGAIRLGYAHGSLPLSLLALARVSRVLGDVEAAGTYARDGRAAALQMQDTAVATACDEQLALLDVEPCRAALVRRGAGWVAQMGDEHAALADSKGLQHLARLVRRPGQHLSASVLAGLVDGTTRTGGDAGPLLDRKAVAAYRERLRQLDADIEDASRAGHETALGRAQDERDALVAQLASGTALGGRLRLDKSDAERARVNVTRTIRDAIERIGAGCPTLAQHLRDSVSTGTWCLYEPDRPIEWDATAADPDQ